jgi:hypothetical protein
MALSLHRLDSNILVLTLDVQREFPKDAKWSTTTCQQTPQWRLPARKTPFASRDQEEH